jgi:PAS domain S-box-containing protein
MKSQPSDWAIDTQVNILLVDDKPRNLDVLESILQSPDYRLVRAMSANEALLALMKDEFACIVLDVQMPETSGLELAKLIKQRKRSQHVPILFLTAYFLEDKDILEGYGVGAVDYLTKPFNPLILKSKVSVFVELFLAARALTRANDALELQITHRKEAQDSLRQLNAELEARVQRRTEELQQANAALAKSEEQLRRAIEEAPIPVIMQAEDGQVLQISKTWVQLTGYSLEEAPAFDSWLTRAYGFGANDLRNAVRSLFERDSGMVAVEFEITTRSGQRRTWAFSASSPGRLHDGRRFVVGMAVDITERKTAEESLRHSEERYRHLVHALPAAVYTCDVQGRILLYNEAAVDLWGRRPEIGKDKWCGSWRIYEPDGTPLPLEECPMSSAVRNGQSSNGREIVVERPDGSRSSVMVYPHPTRDARGKVTGAVNMMVDITARKRAEESLREAKTELEAASKAKDDFLAALSHELRTPLTPAVLLASEWERDTSLPEAARRAFASIREDIDLEARLIDDLLDLTRIAHGKTRLVPQPIEIHQLLRASWERVQSEATEKQLGVRFNLDAANSWTQADPVRLQQVFWNVFKNAVRFSPAKGEINVRTQTSPEGRLSVQIVDQGTGIEPGDLERIFLPFDQGHRGHRTGGLGLGLAISRRLIELHGGRITAASDGLGRGATFSIELPVTAARPEPKTPPPAAENHRPKMCSRRILLVEDHHQTRDTLARLLASRGHEVATAETIKQARDVAQTFAYDLVLSDLGLPDGNGHELMNELRQLRPACQGIALSGYGMDSDIQQSRSAGFDLHLTKPVDIGALENALDQASQERRRAPQERR